MSTLVIESNATAAATDLKDSGQAEGRFSDVRTRDLHFPVKNGGRDEPVHRGLPAFSYEY